MEAKAVIDLHWCVGL